MFSAVFFATLCCALVPASLAAFSYSEQDQWEPICNSGNTGRQSPIDIITSDVVVDNSLTPLQFSATWDTPTSTGVFGNNGQTVEFNIDATSPPIITNFPPLNGTYIFTRTHFHWGNTTNIGSEHIVDGQSAELEIHLVHERMEDGPNGTRLGVIGVLADVVDDDITEPWSTFDVSNLVNVNASYTVSNFTLSSLLPANRAYWHYEGGLTTPPCNEFLQWFVLQERVTVPSAYLEQLRQIQDFQGDLLVNSYRYPQPLGDRVVRTGGASTIGSSVSLVATMCLALLAVFKY